MVPAQAYDPAYQLQRWRQGNVPRSVANHPRPGSTALNTSRHMPLLPMKRLPRPTQSAGRRDPIMGSTLQPPNAPLRADVPSQTRALPHRIPIHTHPSLARVDLKLALALDAQSRVPTTKLIRLAPPISSSISIAQNDTHALELDGVMLNFHVINRKICRPVVHHQTRLFLVGMKEGTTQLDVLVESPAADKPIVKRFEIEVRKLKVDKVTSLQRTVEVLELSIQSGFPAARVQISLFDGEIIVSGDCPNEPSAKKILRLVRRTCPTPVWDQLRVR